MKFTPADFIKTVTCEDGLVCAEVHNLVTGKRQAYEFFFFGWLSLRLKRAHKWADAQIATLTKHAHEPRALLRRQTDHGNSEQKEQP